MDATLCVHVSSVLTGVDPVMSEIGEIPGRVIAQLPLGGPGSWVRGDEVLAVASQPHGQRRAWLAQSPAWVQEVLREPLLDAADPPAAVLEVIGTDVGPFQGGVAEFVRPRGERHFAYVATVDIPGQLGELSEIIAERRLTCDMGLLGLYATPEQEAAWQQRGQWAPPVTDADGAPFDFIGSGLFTVLP